MLLFGLQRHSMVCAASSQSSAALLKGFAAAVGDAALDQRPALESVTGPPPAGFSSPQVFCRARRDRAALGTLVRYLYLRGIFSAWLFRHLAPNTRVTAGHLLCRFL